MASGSPLQLPSPTALSSCSLAALSSCSLAALSSCSLAALSSCLLQLRRIALSRAAWYAVRAMAMASNGSPTTSSKDVEARSAVVAECVGHPAVDRGE